MLVSILVSLSIYVIFTCNATGANLTISAPDRVAVGERFRVVYTVDARPSDFQSPSFGELRVLSGPSQSTSQSTQIINNQVTTSFSISYTYLLEASREGSFTIGPARAVVDGSTYTSDSHTVVVSGQAAAPAQPQPSQPQQPSVQQGPTAQDIFVRAQVSNPTPYQSEQVIVTYKLYTRIGVSRYSIDRLPSYQGFWSENLATAAQPQPSVEVVDGQQYNVVELRRVALFPQRSGEMRIDPLEVECLVRMRTARRGSIFDDFFGGFQDVPHKVRSNPVVLNVKPIPTQNRPASFKGLVGRFEMSANVSPTELQVNDAANLTVTISGSGNLRLAERPDMQFPPNLEVFDPNVSDQIRNEGSGVIGSRTYDYTLIPRTGGEFEIPEIHFTFFDPSSGLYVTRKSGPFSLQAGGLTGPVNEAEGTIFRSDAQAIATDIRFINTRPVILFRTGKLWYRSNAFYFLTALPLLLFAIALVVGRRQIKLRSNRALMRTKKAEQTARKRLKKAARYLQTTEEQLFYDEIFRALWGYISDRLSIPVSRLNKDELARLFSLRSVPGELSRSFFDALNACEFARFAPGDPGEKKDEVYHRTLNAIVSMEKQFRNKRGTPL